MAETDYAKLVRDAEAAAALRLRRGVRPPGGVARAPGRQEGGITEFLREQEAKTPGEAAAQVALSFVGPAALPARIGGKATAAGLGALGATLFADEAEAAPKLPVPKGVRAPAVQRSAFDRPLFDYSRMREVPDVPQFDLPRVVPPRGIPERTLAVDTPENVARVNAAVQRGMEKGGLEWYQTMPLKEGWIGEVGEKKGTQFYDKYLDYVGATSPRSRPPQNARTASYYQTLDEQGAPFPQPVKVGSNWSMPEGLVPEGYGGLAQALHAQNAAAVREGGWAPSTILQKPKPPSFTENLRGNYQPVTIDYLDSKLLNLRDTKGQIAQKPPEGSYGFLERLQQREAPKLGIAPAQYQSSGWIEEAGGGAYSTPFLKIVEDRVKQTARDKGLTPEQVLRRFYRREMPIALGGAAVLSGAGEQR